MNARPALAALLCAAAVHAAPAAAQTDTASVATVPATSATGQPAGAAAPDEKPAVVVNRGRRTRGSLNVISYEELEGSTVTSVQELIRTLRPSWLRTPRGPTSISNQGDLAVFRDGVRMGSREALASMPVTAIRTIRFYNAVEARQKFGGETSAGVIEISSR